MRQEMGTVAKQRQCVRLDVHFNIVVEITLNIRAIQVTKKENHYGILDNSIPKSSRYSPKIVSKNK